MNDFWYKTWIFYYSWDRHVAKNAFFQDAFSYVHTLIIVGMGHVYYSYYTLQYLPEYNQPGMQTITSLWTIDVIRPYT